MPKEYIIASLLKLAWKHGQIMRMIHPLLETPFISKNFEVLIGLEQLFCMRGSIIKVVESRNTRYRISKPRPGWISQKTKSGEKAIEKVENKVEF